MTRLPTNNETVPATDPFDGTEMKRRIVLTPIQETKFPPSRAIAAAYWISYFTLHWLLLLEVIESTFKRETTTVYFLVTAVLATVMITAEEAAKGKKKSE